MTAKPPDLAEQLQLLLDQIQIEIESAHTAELAKARPHLELALATLLCKEPA
jgi:hypothetical protein